MTLHPEPEQFVVKSVQGTSWTEERVERLKVLWAEGLSASVIAAALGGITRNAVCGKIDRLGLPKRHQNEPRPECRVRKSRTIKVTGKARFNKHQIVFQEIEVVDDRDAADCIIPLGQRRTLLELTKDTCRWPIGEPGEPDFFFCGGQPAKGLPCYPYYTPYCPYHTRVAYQPATGKVYAWHR